VFVAGNSSTLVEPRVRFPFTAMRSAASGEVDTSAT